MRRKTEKTSIPKVSVFLYWLVQCCMEIMWSKILVMFLSTDLIIVTD